MTAIKDIKNIKLFKGFNEEDNKVIEEEIKHNGINFICIPASVAFADLPIIHIKGNQLKKDGAIEKDGEPSRYIHGKGKIFEFLRGQKNHQE